MAGSAAAGPGWLVLVFAPFLASFLWGPSRTTALRLFPSEAGPPGKAPHIPMGHTAGTASTSACPRSWEDYQTHGAVSVPPSPREGSSLLDMGSKQWSQDRLPRLKPGLGLPRPLTHMPGPRGTVLPGVTVVPYWGKS